MLSEFSATVNYKHGLTDTRTFRIWSNMLRRCGNPNATGYKYWGGRGIKVCERWQKFENFLVDMGQCPRGLSLERRENDKNYCKENCKWATKVEQARNTRSNLLVAFLGQTKCLAQWCSELGLDYSKAYQRLRLGWTAERALTTP